MQVISMHRRGCACPPCFAHHTRTAEQKHSERFHLGERLDDVLKADVTDFVSWYRVNVIRARHCVDTTIG